MKLFWKLTILGTTYKINEKVTNVMDHGDVFIKSKSMPLNLFSLDLKYICDIRPMRSSLIFFKRNKRKRFYIPEKAQGTSHTA